MRWLLIGHLPAANVPLINIIVHLMDVAIDEVREICSVWDVPVLKLLLLARYGSAPQPGQYVVANAIAIKPSVADGATP